VILGALVNACCARVCKVLSTLIGFAASAATMLATIAPSMPSYASAHSRTGRAFISI